MTLQELRKQSGLTNYKIGRALGVSESVASHIIQGRHLRVYHDEQITQLADVLGVTFERCWMAMQESYNVLHGYPLDKTHQRADEVRAEVQAEMGILLDSPPRAMAMVDGSIVVPEERRIGH